MLIPTQITVAGWEESDWPRPSGMSTPRGRGGLIVAGSDWGHSSQNEGNEYQAKTVAQDRHLHSKAASESKHIWKALNINDETIARRISSMCCTYGARALLPCPLPRKLSSHRKGGSSQEGIFQGASTSSSILEADKLRRLENASLTPFHLLVGGPTAPSGVLLSCSPHLSAAALRQDLTGPSTF